MRFDPPTSGLWAQHASTAPLCARISTQLNEIYSHLVDSIMAEIFCRQTFQKHKLKWFQIKCIPLGNGTSLYFYIISFYAVIANLNMQDNIRLLDSLVNASHLGLSVSRSETGARFARQAGLGDQNQILCRKGPNLGPTWPKL